MPDNLGLMDWSIFACIIRQCAKHRCPSIKLNWRGEPLIHPLLGEMVRIAKKAGILEVQINTNAQLLTAEKSDELCDAGLDRIIISADGITKETYEKIRLNASWDKLLSNISYLSHLKDRPIIRVQTCELPQNKEEIPGYKNFWSKYADEVVVHQSFDPLRKKNTKLRRKSKKRCPQIWQRLVVSWDGNIHPCCVDWAGQGVLGNVRKMTLKQAWRSPKLQFMRLLHKQHCAGLIKPCKNCDNFLI